MGPGPVVVGYGNADLLVGLGDIVDVLDSLDYSSFTKRAKLGLVVLPKVLQVLKGVAFGSLHQKLVHVGRTQSGFSGRGAHLEQVAINALAFYVLSSVHNAMFAW